MGSAPQLPFNVMSVRADKLFSFIPHPHKVQDVCFRKYLSLHVAARSRHASDAILEKASRIYTNSADRGHRRIRNLKYVKRGGRDSCEIVQKT